MRKPSLAKSKCEYCGKEFTHRKTIERKFCSQTCYYKHKPAGKKFTIIAEITNCIHCGKELRLRPSDTIRDRCSPTCREGKIFQERKKEKVCPICFLTHKKVGKFCSKKCSYKDPARRKIYSDTMRRTNISRKEIISERMRTNNPSKNPLTVSKQIATRRLNGTLTIKERGGNGKGPTVPEQILLSSLGNKWKHNRSVKTFPGKRTPGYPPCYKIDVSNLELMIGIEVDGGSHKIEERKNQDQKKEKRLKELGWKVLRFTNKEVMTNLSWVLLEIKKEIKAL
jgi:endogenous inhibitor of DNA gyrase (YacG/DUF329 family)